MVSRVCLRKTTCAHLSAEMTLGVKSYQLPDVHLSRSGEGPEEQTPASRPGERLVASRPSCVSRKLLRA